VSYPERICTDCNMLHNSRVAARFIVYEADGLAKYACEVHKAPFDAAGLHWESLHRFFERLDAMDAARRLGAEPPPSEEEMLTALALSNLNGVNSRGPREKDHAFFHGTIRRCLNCKRPVFGGPVRCIHCADSL
jgi:hypothetical protein